MRTIFVLLLSICLASCDEPVKVDFNGRESKSSCLIDALVYKSAYDAQYQLKSFTYSKILVIKYKKAKNGIDGHATCVFIVNTKQFPNPKFDKLFSFDRNSGSQQIPIQYKEKPLSIALYLYGSERVELAWFLE